MDYEEIVSSSLLWFKIFSFSLNIGTSGFNTMLTPILPLLSIEANEIMDYYPPQHSTPHSTNLRIMK